MRKTHRTDSVRIGRQWTIWRRSLGRSPISGRSTDKQSPSAGSTARPSKFSRLGGDGEQSTVVEHAVVLTCIRGQCCQTLRVKQATMSMKMVITSPKDACL